jgi:hypothetical protein
MKPIDEILDDGRVNLIQRGEDGATFFFRPGGRGTITLGVVVSDGEGWDHASVTVDPRFGNRCPTWDEMDLVRDLVWRADECVMQLHVPRADHINCHPYCLHLWKPQDGEIPRPPGWMVGPVRKEANHG